MNDRLSVRQYIRFSIEEGLRYAITYSLHRTRDIMVFAVYLIDSAIVNTLPRDIQPIGADTTTEGKNES